MQPFRQILFYSTPYIYIYDIRYILQHISSILCINLIYYFFLFIFTKIRKYKLILNKCSCMLCVSCLIIKQKYINFIHFIFLNTCNLCFYFIMCDVFVCHFFGLCLSFSFLSYILHYHYHNYIILYNCIFVFIFILFLFIFVMKGTVE